MGMEGSTDNSNSSRLENQQKGAEVVQEETSRTETNNGPILWGQERVQPPSKGGTLIQLILLQCLTKATTGLKGQKHNPDQNDNEEKGKEANTGRKEKDSTTTTGDLSGQQPNSNKDNQAEEGKEAEEPEVDLEGFSTGLRSKGQGSRKKDKKKGREEDGIAGQTIRGKEARDSFCGSRETKDHHIQPICGRLCNQSR
jgi:hypothetical protein